MAYLGKTPSQAVRSRYYFTASGGETSLSGTDDNSNTLTFTDGNYVDVSLNGVALVAGSDYNTTTANTIGGLSALTASDVVEVVVYDTFSVFSGNVNSDFSVGGNLSVTGTSTLTGAATLTAGFSASDGCTITTADNTAQLTLKSTDADASAGPLIKMHRDSSSPADGDNLGRFNFIGENDASEEVTYARIHAKANDVTDGTEDGELLLMTTVAGTNRSRVHFTPSETILNEDSIDLDFRVESNGNANMLVVDGGNDSVGIGTATPGGSLEVYKAGTSEVLIGTDNGGTAQLSLYESDDGTKEGLLKYDGLNNRIHLATSGAANALVIPRDSGNVGIGTSSPDTSLHISAASGARLRLQDTTNDVKTDILVGDTSSVIGNVSNHDLAFMTNDVNRMTIDSSGAATFNGVVKVPDGSESAPAIVFSDDTNTGIYSSANDKICFSTGGTERMRITDLGRIEFEVPTNQTGSLQDQRLDWRNENNAGIMAGIGVVREADGNAPGAFVIRTSTNVDSSSNSSDGEISEKFRVASNGDLTATDTSIASNSDQRLKENIADYDYDLAKFKQFQTRTFNWKQPTLHGEKSGVRGFVAQELEAIDSYWVNEIEVQSDSDDYQYLPDTDIPYGPNNIYKPDDAAETDTQRVARFAKTSKLGQKDAMYVSVIQQLLTKIETLETKVAALEAGE